MKQLISYKNILCIVTIMVLVPALAIAQPPDPGGDPFGAPVDGGVVFVAIIALVYGAFRIYQSARKRNTTNID